MKAKIRELGYSVDTDRIEVSIGDSKYTLTEDPNYGLVINKSDFEGNDGIVIKPCVSNEIAIK